MRIVVLDGYALNPGDLSWAGFEALGEFQVHDRTPTGSLLELARDAGCLLTNKTPLDRHALGQLPRLRYIGVLATGYNVVDIPAARELGVTVTHVPNYSTDSVAQLVFTLLFELTHRTGHHAAGVRSGRWCRSPDFSYWDQSLVEISGLTMGIVGYGRIGRKVARIAQAFGMQVLIATRTEPHDLDCGVRWVPLEELLSVSHVVTLHCPLTPATQTLIRPSTLGLMQPAAYLINTGRGGLVDEAALASALNEGRLAGAGLDVLSTEPPAPDNPLLTARNCVVTPHFGWATRAARGRLMDIAVGNLKAYLAGQAINVVS